MITEEYFDYHSRVKEKSLLFELLNIKKEATEKGVVLSSLEVLLSRHTMIMEQGDVAHVKSIFDR